MKVRLVMEPEMLCNIAALVRTAGEGILQEARYLQDFGSLPEREEAADILNQVTPVVTLMTVAHEQMHKQVDEGYDADVLEFVMIDASDEADDEETDDEETDDEEADDEEDVTPIPTAFRDFIDGLL